MEVEILLYSPFIYGNFFILCLKDYLGQQIWMRDGIVEFLTTCGCHHPTIWKFIEALKTEQASVELKQLRFISGENPKKTKKSFEKEKSIINLVNSFTYRPILLYLRGISFKIPFS